MLGVRGGDPHQSASAPRHHQRSRLPQSRALTINSKINEIKRMRSYETDDEIEPFEEERMRTNETDEGEDYEGTLEEGETMKKEMKRLCQSRLRVDTVCERSDGLLRAQLDK